MDLQPPAFSRRVRPPAALPDSGTRVEFGSAMSVHWHEPAEWPGSAGRLSACHGDARRL